MLRIVYGAECTSGLKIESGGRDITYVSRLYTKACKGRNLLLTWDNEAVYAFSAHALFRFARLAPAHETQRGGAKCEWGGVKGERPSELDAFRQLKT